MKHETIAVLIGENLKGYTPVCVSVELPGQYVGANQYINLASVALFDHDRNRVKMQLILEPQSGEQVKGNLYFLAVQGCRDYQLTYEIKKTEMVLQSGRYGNHFLLLDEHGKVYPMPYPTMQAEPAAPRDGIITLSKDERPILKYHSIDEKRPYIFPFFAANGKNFLAQGLPTDPDRGHSHHAGIWIGHHDINGINFWEDWGDGIIEHHSFRDVKNGRIVTKIRETLHWRIGAQVLLEEERTIQLYQSEKRKTICDLSISLEARAALTFGKTPFGFLGVRTHAAMNPVEGGGYLLNSNHCVGEAKVLGQPADWCAFVGNLSGSGYDSAVAVFNHPDNGSVCWQSRDNGFLAPSASGQMEQNLKTGERLNLKYRIYSLVASKEPEEELRQAWDSYITVI